ncbi:MAG: hypothetical protein RBR86_03200 [Pseudobdellovibrionaceae bacterium]|jgi:FMN phosphatase YigB (HAD superfamily)|nr:hypothetical protein [Pseudobdellovibrionaceae bacterium]
MTILIGNYRKFADVRQVLFDVDGTLYSEKGVGYRLESFFRVLQTSAQRGLGLGLLNPFNLAASFSVLDRGLHQAKSSKNNPLRGKLLAYSMLRMSHSWTKVDTKLPEAVGLLRRVSPDMRFAVVTNSLREQVQPILDRTSLPEVTGALTVADVRFRNIDQARGFKSSETLYDDLREKSVLLVPNEQACLIDNEIKYLESASRNGLKTIWVDATFRDRQKDKSLPYGVDARVTSVSEAVYLLARSKAQLAKDLAI